MNLDFHLVKNISYLLHGNFIFDSDFLGRGAWYLPILACFLEQDDNFFFFQNSILPLTINSVTYHNTCKGL